MSINPRTSAMSINPRTSGPHAPAFSFADITFAFKAFAHLVRTSGPDITGSTIKRFFTAKHGNKERITGIVAAVAVDPIVLQKVAHDAEGGYNSVSDGKVIVMRDFDHFVRGSTELGSGGKSTAALHYGCFPHDAFGAQPERYGECPYGKWEDIKDHQPHLLATDVFPAQVPMMEKLIDDHMQKYIGKTEEIGKITRLLVWNLLASTSYGVEPNDITASMFQNYDNTLGEFDYAVRMTGADIPYEFSPSLVAFNKQLEEWSKSVVEDRIANIDKYSDYVDVLTENVRKGYFADMVMLEGPLRNTFQGGLNNMHSAIAGGLLANSISNDAVHDYLMQNPGQNVDHISREAMRLYTAVPAARAVHEKDDFSLDGKKLEPGTLVLMNTWVNGTDPRSWENPMEFDASRFENTHGDIGYMTRKGSASLGVSAPNVGMGGRTCVARYYVTHFIRTVLNKVLRDYKLTASGGYFDFQHSAGGSRYKGKCMVTVEKR